MSRPFENCRHVGPCRGSSRAVGFSPDRMGQGPSWGSVPGNVRETRAKEKQPEGCPEKYLNQSGRLASMTTLPSLSRLKLTVSGPSADLYFM